MSRNPYLQCIDLILSTGEYTYLNVLGQHVIVLGSYEAANALLEGRSAISSGRSPCVMAELSVHDSILPDTKFTHTTTEPVICLGSSASGDTPTNGVAIGRPSTSSSTRMSSPTTGRLKLNKPGGSFASSSMTLTDSLDTLDSG